MSCRNRNIAMCEKFTQLGIPIDYSDMEKEYADAVITRAHFADYLLKKGYIKSRNEAFDRYIGSNGPCYVPRKKMPCAEAIRLIKMRAVFQPCTPCFIPPRKRTDE